MDVLEGTRQTTDEIQSVTVNHQYSKPNKMANECWYKVSVLNELATQYSEDINYKLNSVYGYSKKKKTF